MCDAYVQLASFMVHQSDDERIDYETLLAFFRDLAGGIVATEQVKVKQLARNHLPHSANMIKHESYRAFVSLMWMGQP